jgi:hypothetical protein
MLEREHTGSYLPAYWHSVSRPVLADYGVAMGSDPKRSSYQAIGTKAYYEYDFSPNPWNGRAVQRSPAKTDSSHLYIEERGSGLVETPTRVGLCLPCDVADALVGADGKNCNCTKALSFLVRLGAIHTARMHAAKAAINPNRWMPEDWYAHMDEEERLFFPLLPEPVAAQLIEEHHQFDRELKIYGRITSDTILEQHSAAEDAWAEYLMTYMAPAKIIAPGNEHGAATGAIETAESGGGSGPFWVMLGALIVIGGGALFAQAFGAK